MAKPSAFGRLKQVLLWYDEPQIVLLAHGAHRYIVGVAIEHDGHHSAFVGADVSVRQLLDYKMQRIDLRYLFLRPDGRKWWLFDLDTDCEDIPLVRVKADCGLVDENAPETGFFARFHDEIQAINVPSADTVYKFEIDGTWDLGEFSQFYGQVADLYYMFHNAREFEKKNASPARQNQIRKAFTRPFRGGGSYLALYNDFANDNDRAARLRVSGIQYHSPGYVEVRALEAPFTDAISLLQTFAQNLDTLKKAYNNLHKTLSGFGLLKSEQTYLSPDVRAKILALSDGLANGMDGLTFKEYMALAGDNVVVSAKVLLSVYRRVERLYQFFQEGRAKHAEVPVG